MTVITHAWKTQAGLPGSFQMSAKNQLSLPRKQDLLKNSEGKNHPLIQENLGSLVAWTISEKIYMQKEYQKGYNPYHKL